uniref:GIY-YIG endonuclease n=1 Tax=Ramaria rubella TaxID=113071 RepID=UPI002238F20E|nr:GIY-YIG endonuclease [Ramaria rubella]UYR22224.1 GIY-YIG endonuclease [Ramaria rubella]
MRIYLNKIYQKEKIIGINYLNHLIILKIFYFTGSNYYRFGSKVSKNIKLKISKGLKGRILSEAVKANHVLGANKKHVYCYCLRPWNTKNLLMEFKGIRIMVRALKVDKEKIRLRLDKNNPLNVTIENKNYIMLFSAYRLPTGCLEKLLMKIIKLYHMTYKNITLCWEFLKF